MTNAMQTFYLDEGDLYITDDIAKELGVNTVDEAEDELERSLKLLLQERPKFREFIDVYGQVNGLAGLAVLSAHGLANDSSSTWKYVDGEGVEEIQTWIDSNDGDYSALLLYSCNGDHYTPTSKQSVILVPDRKIIDIPHIFNEPVYSLLVPGREEVDSNTVDYEIEEMKKKLA
tara:strand:+ start:703 stop:1224 length:522 start_codon:yes stop_codon:yes gene_type:complete